MKRERKEGRKKSLLSKENQPPYLPKGRLTRRYGTRLTRLSIPIPQGMRKSRNKEPLPWVREVTAAGVNFACYRRKGKDDLMT
jgi:hypothetical protein